MTTVPTSPVPATEPDRHYTVLEIVHNDNGTGTMEVLFYEDGHTLRYNLWLPDDPSKIDDAVRAAWPHVDFENKLQAAANIKARIDDFKKVVAVRTAVSGLKKPEQPATHVAGPANLGVQRPGQGG